MPEFHFKTGDYIRGNNNVYGITNENMILGLVVGSGMAFDEPCIKVRSLINSYYHPVSIFRVKEEFFSPADFSDDRVKRFFELSENYLFDSPTQNNRPLSEVFSVNWNLYDITEDEVSIIKLINVLGKNYSIDDIVLLAEGHFNIRLYKK